MPKNIFPAKKKYVSVFRGCSFYDLGCFNTFLSTRKRTLFIKKINFKNKSE